MLLIHVGPPELFVIRNRGFPLFRGSFYTLLYGLLAERAANVRYREVSAIQGSIIEGFQCSDSWFGLLAAVLIECTVIFMDILQPCSRLPLSIC